MSQILKLILLFFNMGKAYTRKLVASGAHYEYTDTGDGDITITIEEG